MRCFIKVFLLVLTSAAVAAAADDNRIESTRAREDVALTTYPVAAFWQSAGIKEHWIANANSNTRLAKENIKAPPNLNERNLS